MANPQPDKFTKISNELFDALINIRIPGESRQVLDFIIRKTYGFNKKVDRISISQFTEATGIHKSHIQRAINKLIDMNVIVTQKGNDFILSYSINKDYDLWKRLPKKVTAKKLPKKVTAVTFKGLEVTQKGNKKLPKKGYTKDIKDNITKDTLNTGAENPLGLNVKKLNPVKEIYDFYIEVSERDSKLYMLTDKRKIKIKARLKEFNKTDISQAIQGMLSDKYMQGDNDKGIKYIDLDYVIQSTEKCEKWRNRFLEERDKQNA